MGQLVTQSKYFSKDFNTAIIDGPLRVYFSDRQEGEALKIYFQIQEALGQRGCRLDDKDVRGQAAVFLMLYPDQRAFSEKFPQEKQTMACDIWENHLIMGTAAPMDYDLCYSVCQWVTEKIVPAKGVCP